MMGYEHYLWASNRSEWVRKPHGKEQKKKTHRCIFCAIVKGDKSVPAKVIYRGKLSTVIMNIFPYNVGHLEVIPNRHVVWPGELPKREFIDMFRTVDKAMRLLKKALNPVGFNIGINLGGAAAGASIMHLHVQIVPRYERDLGFMETTAETKVMPESLDKTMQKMMPFLSVMKE
jgi:ATP adenylyltransferase